MNNFKNIKHFNCNLDFNLTHLLTVGGLLSSNAGRGEIFDVESASIYVAGKHRILTIMNISGSFVIHIMIMLCLPLPSV